MADAQLREPPRHETTKLIDDGQVLFFALFGTLTIFQLLWLLWVISQLTVRPLETLRRVTWKWCGLLCCLPCKLLCPSRKSHQTNVQQETDIGPWLGDIVSDENQTQPADQRDAVATADENGAVTRNLNASFGKMSTELKTLNKLLEKLVSQNDQRTERCAVGQEDVRTPKIRRRPWPDSVIDSNHNDTIREPSTTLIGGSFSNSMRNGQESLTATPLLEFRHMQPNDRRNYK